MNVIQIIRAACGTTGITRPSNAVGSADSGIVQLLELLNEEGSELAARGNWQALTAEKTFTTVATESQGTLVSIIGAANNYRHIVNETIWNRTTKEPICVIDDPGAWQAWKALGVTGSALQYRVRGGELLFLQVPTADQTCAFEYVTKNWLTDSTGASFYSSANADEDVSRLDDELILTGLKWRWLKSKGLEFGENYAQYERRVVDALAKDGTKRTRSLAGNVSLTGIPVGIPRLIGS